MLGVDEDRKQKQKEKRRLQEQLRRLQRNAEQQKNLTALLQLPKEEDNPLSLSSSQGILPPSSGSQLKCGACGLVGHMRTNRTCPFFQEPVLSAAIPSSPSPNVKEEIPSQDIAPGTFYQ